ncbi:hypothetical protein FOL47_001853 [Perkinsus chesapeaki]|uniref:Uncharacterized protein n=1 Tax=Perkinsus chesapeaki TaxID=330153 RepID=A0A7J6KQR9_PERCH|nr:hypothetical protein FOL47_001853 [Perkinsus chesapeaki]
MRAQRLRCGLDILTKLALDIIPASCIPIRIVKCRGLDDEQSSDHRDCFVDCHFRESPPEEKSDMISENLTYVDGQQLITGKSPCSKLLKSSLKKHRLTSPMIFISSTVAQQGTPL